MVCLLSYFFLVVPNFRVRLSVSYCHAKNCLVRLLCPLAPIPMRPDSLLRLWRYINHLLTYLLRLGCCARSLSVSVHSVPKRHVLRQSPATKLSFWARLLCLDHGSQNVALTTHLGVVDALSTVTATRPGAVPQIRRDSLSMSAYEASQ